jgi:hypothetical protein
VVYPDPGRPQTTTACTINCKAAINDANSTAAHQTTAPNAAPPAGPGQPSRAPVQKEAYCAQSNILPSDPEPDRSICWVWTDVGRCGERQGNATPSSDCYREASHLSPAQWHCTFLRL